MGAAASVSPTSMPPESCDTNAFLASNSSISLFVRKSISFNLDLETIRLFLKDFVAYQMFKRFIIANRDKNIALWRAIEGIVVLDKQQPIPRSAAVPLAVVLTSFRKFLDSKYFLQWMAAKNADVLIGIIGESSDLDKALIDSSGAYSFQSTFMGSDHSSEDDKSSASVCDVTPIAPFLNKSVDYYKMVNLSSTTLAFRDAGATPISKADFSNVMKEASWLSSLIATAQNLPISFSVTSATCDSNHAFPLIYVNQRFENLSGYSRAEVVGKDYSFLQRLPDGTCVELLENIEPNAKLHRALALSQMIDVDLTNFKKDGTRFRSRVMVKPIYDQHKKYRYVIGLQFELTGNPSHDRQAVISKHLLGLLPSQIVVDNHDTKSI